MDVRQKISEIRENGFTCFPNYINKEECEKYIDISEGVLEKLKVSNEYFMSNDAHYILSPFQYDEIFLKLIYDPLKDKILKELLDEDYTLISSSINNPKMKKIVNKKGEKISGDDWHTDSRVLGGKRLDSGFCYLNVIMLDDFTLKNGGTHYVPGSHLRRDIPDRQGSYKYNVMEGKAGTMVIMDSGIWHRRGNLSDTSRWSMFNLYGPWFMKPYYRFYDMMGESFGKRASKEIRRLLHYNSIPPVNEKDRVATLVK